MEESATAHVIDLSYAFSGSNFGASVIDCSTSIVASSGCNVTPANPRTVTRQLTTCPPSVETPFTSAEPTLRPVTIALETPSGSIFTIEESDDVHVIDLSNAISGSNFGASVIDSFTTMVAFSGSKVTPFNPSTVTRQCTSKPPSLDTPVTSVTPAFTPVTLILETPSASIVAIDGSVTRHVIDLSYASSGVNSGASVIVSATWIVASSCFSVTLVSPAFTIICITATRPDADVACINVVPAFTPVITPFSSTLATLLLYVVHVIASVVSAGVFTRFGV